MKNIYLIKDVSRLSGFSIPTIKYYIRMGLVEEIGRSPSTNFRYFDDSTVSVLGKIKEFRKNNISLEKIKDEMKTLK